MTASLKVILIGMTSPIMYDALFDELVTDATNGLCVSTIIALFAPKEPDAPGDAKVKVAALPLASLIVPPFNARALVLA